MEKEGGKRRKKIARGKKENPALRMNNKSSGDGNHGSTLGKKRRIRRPQ